MRSLEPLEPGEHVDFKCPFCGKDASAGNLQMPEGVYEYAVIHTMPFCQKFADMNAADFMSAVNDATCDDPEELRKLRAWFKAARRV